MYVSVKCDIKLFRERLSEKMCTQQFGKIIWDVINVYSVPETVTVEPTFDAFL